MDFIRNILNFIKNMVKEDDSYKYKHYNYIDSPTYDIIIEKVADKFRCVKKKKGSKVFTFSEYDIAMNKIYENNF